MSSSAVWRKARKPPGRHGVQGGTQDRARRVREHVCLSASALRVRGKDKVACKIAPRPAQLNGRCWPQDMSHLPSPSCSITPCRLCPPLKSVLPQVSLTRHTDLHISLARHTKLHMHQSLQTHACTTTQVHLQAPTIAF